MHGHVHVPTQLHRDSQQCSTTRYVKVYVQLNDSIVQGSTHPRTDRVKGQAFDASGFALKLGQHYLYLLF